MIWKKKINDPWVVSWTALWGMIKVYWPHLMYYDASSAHLASSSVPHSVVMDTCSVWHHWTHLPHVVTTWVTAAVCARGTDQSSTPTWWPPPPPSQIVWHSLLGLSQSCGTLASPCQLAGFDPSVCYCSAIVIDWSVNMFIATYQIKIHVHWHAMRHGWEHS